MRLLRQARALGIPVVEIDKVNCLICLERTSGFYQKKKGGGESKGREKSRSHLQN